MKFAVAYYLLLIYLTVMLQPLIPIAEDALFHCFAEAYHVATVHAKYGNNHLETALANDEKDDNSGKNQTSAKNVEQTLVHIATKEISTLNTLKSRSEKIFCCFTQKLCTIHILKIFPPPKFS